MSYHEVPKIGRNKIVRGAACSYRELLGNYKNWGTGGAARSLHELMIGIYKK